LCEFWLGWVKVKEKKVVLHTFIYTHKKAIESVIKLKPINKRVLLVCALRVYINKLL